MSWSIYQYSSLRTVNNAISTIKYTNITWVNQKFTIIKLAEVEKQTSSLILKRFSAFKFSTKLFTNKTVKILIK